MFIALQAADLPPWVWLPWIPQLITSLQRPEIGAARRVLAAAAVSYPQLMYWHIRPSMQHLKEIAVAAVAEAKQKQQLLMQQQASAAAGEEKKEKAEGDADATAAAGGEAGAAPAAPTEQQPPQIEKPHEVSLFTHFIVFLCFLFYKAH